MAAKQPLVSLIINEFNGVMSTIAKKFGDNNDKLPPAHVEDAQFQVFFSFDSVKKTEKEFESSKILISLSGKTFSGIFEILNNNRRELQNLTNMQRKLEINAFSQQLIDNYFEKTLCRMDGLNRLFKAVATKADGNCLYNSIAMLLYGNDGNFHDIKLGSIFMLLEYEEYFRNLIFTSKLEYSFESFVENTCLMKSWGTEYNQIAISLLCDRPLNIYSVNPARGSFFSQEYRVHLCQAEKIPLTIGFIINHFTALMPVKKNNIPPPTNMNQFISSFSIEKFKEYSI